MGDGRNVATAGALLFGLLAVTTANATTLREAVSETLASDPDVRFASDNRLSVEQELEQARGGFYPSLDLDLGYGWEQTNNPATRARGRSDVELQRGEAGLFFRQMLFDGFETRNEVDRQVARLASRAHTVFGESERRALDAVEAYLAVSRNRALLDLANANLASHERTYEQIKLRSDAGRGSRADLDTADGRLALARANQIAAEANLADAMTNYLRVVGSPPGVLEEVVAPLALMPASLDEAVEQAVANHPTLKAAESDVEAAREQHEVSRAVLLPRIDFEMSARSDNHLDGVSGYDESLNAMFRLRYNLFSGGADEARRRQTAHQIDEALDVHERTLRQVIESIRLSWNALDASQNRLTYLEQHRISADSALGAYQKQFNIGQRSLLDLLDQENEVFEAGTAHLTGEYDVQFSTFRVLAGIARLLDSLDIPRPVTAQPPAYQ